MFSRIAFIAITLIVFSSCSVDKEKLLTGGGTKKWKVENLDVADPVNGPGAYLLTVEGNIFYEFSIGGNLTVFSILDQPTKFLQAGDTTFFSMTSWNFDEDDKLVMLTYNKLVTTNEGARFTVEQLDEKQLIIGIEGCRMEFSAQ